MTARLLLIVAVAGCAVDPAEDDMMGQTESSLDSNGKAIAITCTKLEAQNSLCSVGDVRFESKDLTLTSCRPTRTGIYCVAPTSLSPNLPPELWEAGTANGGVWKTTNFLKCPDSRVACDAADARHCWCDSAAAKGNVEFEWKVEEGES